MIGAQQVVLSSRNCPEDFQMVIPLILVSNDDNAPDDDMKSISVTRAGILSIDI